MSIRRIIADNCKGNAENITGGDEVEWKMGSEKRNIRFTVEWEKVCKQIRDRIKGIADIPIVSKEGAA